MPAGPPTGSTGQRAAGRRSPAGLVSSRSGGTSSPQSRYGSPGQDAAAAATAPPGAGRSGFGMGSHPTLMAGSPRAVASAEVFLDTPQEPSTPRALTVQETKSRRRPMHAATPAEPLATRQWWAGSEEAATATPRSQGRPRPAEPLLVAPSPRQVFDIDWEEPGTFATRTAINRRHGHGSDHMLDNHFGSGSGDGSLAAAPAEGAPREAASTARQAGAHASRASTHMQHMTTLPDSWVGQPATADMPQQQAGKGHRKQKG